MDNFFKKAILCFIVFGLAGCFNGAYVYPEHVVAAEQVCRANGGLRSFYTTESNYFRPGVHVEVYCKNGATFLAVKPAK